MNRSVLKLTNIFKRTLRLQQIRCISNNTETTSGNTDTSRININVTSRKKDKINKMNGYSISAYSGDLDELQYSATLRKPLISSPNQVLVKVNASSVNPIDIAMINGYGSTLLNTIRCGADIEFPLILGRDFCGTVVQKGMDVKNSHLKVGDKIWGVIPVHKQGCHAEFVVADQCCVTKKPENLSDVEAAATLYAGLTAWSGLFLTARLGGLEGVFCPSGGGKGKKVLVLGGSGGVGTMAIQILLAEGARVHATCATDAIDTLQNLGIEKVFDYASTETDVQVVLESPYDLILDCAGRGPEYANALPWKFNNYVTFSSPMLRNFDSLGLVSGGLKNIRDLLVNNVAVMNKNGCVKWGYFVPAPNGIKYLKTLAEHKKLLPIIDSVFKYDNLRNAYEKVYNGHLRGKVAVDYS